MNSREQDIFKENVFETILEKFEKKQITVMVLKFEHASESPGGLLNHEFLALLLEFLIPEIQGRA